jgi:hypothetical protein
VAYPTGIAGWAASTADHVGGHALVESGEWTYLTVVGWEWLDPVESTEGKLA